MSDSINRARQLIGPPTGIVKEITHIKRAVWPYHHICGEKVLAFRVRPQSEKRTMLAHLDLGVLRYRPTSHDFLAHHVADKIDTSIVLSQLISFDEHISRR